MPFLLPLEQQTAGPQLSGTHVLCYWECWLLLIKGCPILWRTSLGQGKAASRVRLCLLGDDGAQKAECCLKLGSTLDHNSGSGSTEATSSPSFSSHPTWPPSLPSPASPLSGNSFSQNPCLRLCFWGTWPKRVTKPELNYTQWNSDKVLKFSTILWAKISNKEGGRSLSSFAHIHRLVQMVLGVETQALWLQTHPPSLSHRVVLLPHARIIQSLRCVCGGEVAMPGRRYDPQQSNLVESLQRTSLLTPLGLSCPPVISYPLHHPHWAAHHSPPRFVTAQL